MRMQLAGMARRLTRELSEDTIRVLIKELYIADDREIYRFTKLLQKFLDEDSRGKI